MSFLVCFLRVKAVEEQLGISDQLRPAASSSEVASFPAWSKPLL